MPVKINGSGYIGTANNIYTDGSGQVGIGTASPTNLLHVKTAADYNTATFESSGAEVNLRLVCTSSTGRDWRLVTGGSGGGFGAGQIGFYDPTAGKRWAIDSNGYVTKGYQPSFRVARSGAGTTTAGYSVYYFDTVIHNVGSCWSTSTNRFTAPIAGKYLITVKFYVNSGAVYFRAQFRINGTMTEQLAWNLPASDCIVTHSSVLHLNVNDYVDMYNDAGTTYTIYGGSGSAHTSISGYLLG